MAMMVVQTSLFKKCRKPQNCHELPSATCDGWSLVLFVKLGGKRLETKGGEIIYIYIYIHIHIIIKIRILHIYIHRIIMCIIYIYTFFFTQFEVYTSRDF